MSSGADSEWHIIPDAADDLAVATLSHDRFWNAFAIGDLEPPFREYSRVALAQGAGSPPSAACLILESPDFNAIVPDGDPAGIAAILRSVDLPSRTAVLLRSEHVVAITDLYDFVSKRRQMVRMAITSSWFRPAATAASLSQLGPSDLDDLIALYTGFPDNHFAPIQLDQGVFFGVRDEGRLVAAGGTHVVCPRYGVAVLGGIYTEPAARGRGFASAVTSALVAHLFDIGCQDVLLNVDASNGTARHVYERIGFRDHCHYETADAVLRQSADVTD